MVRSVKFAAPKLLQTRLQLWRSRFIFLLVALCFVIGITASVVADARDPDADAKQAERAPGHTDEQPEEKQERV